MKDIDTLRTVDTVLANCCCAIDQYGNSNGDVGVSQVKFGLHLDI